VPNGQLRSAVSSNPDLICNLHIHFAPNSTPLQSFNKRGISVVAHGQEIAWRVPGTALQLEGTDALFSRIDSRNEDQFTPVFLYINRREAYSSTDAVDCGDRFLQSRLQAR
jgi:hypothetical protein